MFSKEGYSSEAIEIFENAVGNSISVKIIYILGGSKCARLNKFEGPNRSCKWIKISKVGKIRPKIGIGLTKIPL